MTSEEFRSFLTDVDRRTQLVEIFYPVPFPRLRVLVPLIEAQICAGFPSPADDYLQRPLDLNELLVRHPAATFFFRASGHSMIGANIHDGDLVAVDRSLTAEDGDIIVACVDAEFTIKRLRRNGSRVWLHPENPEFPDIEVHQDQEFTVWGVVTGSVRLFPRRHSR